MSIERGTEMGMLDGYRILENVSGVPTMSITKNGIAFNKSTLEKLKCPKYVVALLNKKEQKFAIVVCDAETSQSREFYKGRRLSDGVRWNNRDLIDTITFMMNWDLNKTGWKTRGNYQEEDDECGIFFDLNQAKPIDESQKE